MILILSDKINSGKSTFCMKCVDELIKRGTPVDGWITPAHMIDGEKVGHDFVSIKNSTVCDAIPFTRMEPFENSFPWRRWHFNAEAFELASELANNSQDTKLFIMDEIGPLEIQEGKGFYTPMQRMLGRRENVLVVIREELADKFTSGHKEFLQFSLAEQDALTTILTQDDINSQSS
jgi:nucleoside-triphosphatase THEP1